MLTVHKYFLMCEFHFIFSFGFCFFMTILFCSSTTRREEINSAEEDVRHPRVRIVVSGSFDEFCYYNTSEENK